MSQNQEQQMDDLTYKEKFIQINKEAKATWYVGAITFIVWLVGGFGIYLMVGNEWTILRMPAWFVIGTFGSWIVSVIGVQFIIKKVFKNFSLDENKEEGK